MDRLGIIDWGIGGVGIYKLIKNQLGVPVTYLSDTGATPYGKMTRRELVLRLDSIIEYLKFSGVTHLVIGCNAASTAIPFLKDHSIKIEGVIESAIESTSNLKLERLGLIGGRRTVISGVYRRAFRAKNLKVKQRIAQPLSALIESGDVSSETLKDECKKILSPLKNCSHILLACTHYPAITEVMRPFVSPVTQFIDPAADLIKCVESWKLSAVGDDVFLTSGDADKMKKAALAAFGVELKKVERLTI